MKKTKGIDVVVIMSCIALAVCMSYTCWKVAPSKEEVEAREARQAKCLVMKYGFVNGNIIYGFPENPYITWKDNRVYLDEEGVCRQ